MAPGNIRWTLVFGLVLAVGALEIPETSSVLQSRPIIIADEIYNATIDAEYLGKLLDDGDDYVYTALAILTQRTAKQRENIFFEINRLYGNAVLFSSLLSFKPNDFRVAMGAALSTSPKLYAAELHDAVSADDEDTILEILLCLDDQSRDKTFEEYESHFATRFLDDFNQLNVSENFKDIVDNLCSDARSKSSLIDKVNAKKTAGALGELLESSKTIDFSVLNSILLLKNDAQIRQIDREYVELTNHTIRTAVNEKFDGATRDVYNSILTFSINPHEYLANRLHEAIFDYEEPDLTTINRIIIGRFEIDLLDIKEYYLKHYSSYLSDDLTEVTSGRHRDLLLMFLDEYDWQ